MIRFLLPQDGVELQAEWPRSVSGGIANSLAVIVDRTEHTSRSFRCGDVFGVDRPARRDGGEEGQGTHTVPQHDSLSFPTLLASPANRPGPVTVSRRR
jgi:hypothetical protein